MDKRYQVFISSTYADLKEERRAVIQSVIELNCIPAGMELFPASNEEQLQFIKRVIDDCDYYLLIIAGRYGSVGPDGVSYTEKEFDYAVKRGLPVIAFPHGNPDDISYGKSEKDPAFKKKLEDFRAKVCTGRIVKMWNNPQELPGFVAQSLSTIIHRHPATGWVRANRVASEEILTEINDLRKRNADLQSTLAKFKHVPPVADLAGLDEKLRVFGTVYYHSTRQHDDWELEVTWSELFGYISPYLAEHPADLTVKDILEKALFAKKGTLHRKDVNLNEQLFKTIAVQLSALGLVSIKYSQSTSGRMALFWSATPAGERLMLELRTIRTKNQAT